LSFLQQVYLIIIWLLVAVLVALEQMLMQSVVVAVLVV
jgi:hypothetical protein